MWVIFGAITWVILENGPIFWFKCVYLWVVKMICFCESSEEFQRITFLFVCVLAFIIFLCYLCVTNFLERRLQQSLDCRCHEGSRAQIATFQRQRMAKQNVRIKIDFRHRFRNHWCFYLLHHLPAVKGNAAQWVWIAYIQLCIPVIAYLSAARLLTTLTPRSQECVSAAVCHVRDWNTLCLVTSCRFMLIFAA